MGLVLLALAGVPAPVRAQGSDVAREAATADAREAFRLGSALARAGQWKDALAAFERSSKLRPHAITTYNIAYCERSLGHYTLARKLLLEAFAQSEAHADQRLSEDVEVRARGYLAEVERKVARVKVSLKPARLALAIDGRPLEKVAAGEWLGGTRDPGNAEPVPADQLELVIDPGHHVIVFSSDQKSRTLQVSLESGNAGHLVLELAPRSPRAAPSAPDRTWALLSLGAGASGVLVGALAGAAALNEKATLDDHCPLGKDRCERRYQGDIDAMNRYATVSTVAFGVGAVGLGLGTYLWLAGDSEAKRRESLSLVLGPSGGGVRGRF
ncbi:MAG: tetratricopeptide repeat protein [Myxococcales bacterium]|nr:tetratricopeptide repeat protein [Myxococcales bacterium]